MVLPIQLEFLNTFFKSCIVPNKLAYRETGLVSACTADDQFTKCTVEKNEIN